MVKRQRNQLRPAEAAVSDTMGRLAELWGLRRNLGKTWAVLFLKGRPLTAVEVRRLLGMSTGAVSMTLRELQRWGVIRRVQRIGDRHKLYLAEVDVWRVVSRMLRGRELIELDAAVDQLEAALAELRHDLDAADDDDERRELELGAKRTEGLLDLFRMLSSMLRVLATTGKLDAAMLASIRLGGDENDENGADEGTIR